MKERNNNATPPQPKRAKTIATQSRTWRLEGLFDLVDSEGNVLDESARESLVIGHWPAAAGEVASTLQKTRYRRSQEPP